MYTKASSLSIVSTISANSYDRVINDYAMQPNECLVRLDRVRFGRVKTIILKVLDY